MAPTNSEKTQSKSPYVASNVFADAKVTKLAEEFRTKRLALRCLSSLLARLPFHSSAIYKQPSLHDWLSSATDPVSEDGDFLFEFARYLDWWERSAIYKEAPLGKDRRKNKEIRLLIRRFGLGDDDITPAPHQFIAINGRGGLRWTDTHQWLILLRYFDILAKLRGVVDPMFDRVPPSPARLLVIGRSLTPGWLSMRLDWQAAVKDTCVLVKAAHGFYDGSTPPAAPAITASSSSQSSTVATSGSFGRVPVWVKHTSSPQEVEDAQAVARVVIEKQALSLDAVFTLFDQMSLTSAFDRILPEVKHADDTSQYVAMCVNIQLAALVVNYIQSNVREGVEDFRLKDIASRMPEDMKADWKTARYIYQPCILMIMYSPLFLLAKSRLYSSPLPSFAHAFEIFKAIGNVGKPRALEALEDSIWALVLQVAHGASVYDVFPVYAAGWSGSIDIAEVTECKSWLDDFSSKAAESISEYVQDWDDDDEIQVVREYTSQRDELRDWKPDILNLNGKRRPASPGPEAPAKRARKDRKRKAASKRQASPPPGKTRKSQSRPKNRSRPHSSSPEKKSDSRHTRPTSTQQDDEEDEEDGTGDHAASSKTNQGAGRGDADGDNRDADLFSGRLTPLDKDDHASGDDGVSRGPRARSRNTSPMNVDHGSSRSGSQERSRHGTEPLGASSQDDVAQQQHQAAASPSTRPNGRKDRTKKTRQPTPYEPLPVTVPAWTSTGLLHETWSPVRQRTHALFSLLATHTVTGYAPGSSASSVRVFDAEEFRKLGAQQVQDVFQKSSILVRGNGVDTFWKWGLEAFSAMRPIYGTVVQVQDPIASYEAEGFRTISVSIPELVKAGQQNTATRWNCLDLPMGLEHLSQIPYVAEPGPFNVLPYAYRVCGNEPDAYEEGEWESNRSKLHWALAGVAGADTMQHMDVGGFATTVHVLSGRKLWAIGSRKDGRPFPNDSHCIAKEDVRADWHSFHQDVITWETLVLEAGDTLYMRPGPHVVHTLDSSICYGEYFLTPKSLVDHVTSYAVSRLANLVVTNDSFQSGPVLLALASWWWNGDLGCEGDWHDPSGELSVIYLTHACLSLSAARASRPSLSEDVEVYIALLALYVFQTTLAVDTYEEDEAAELGVTMEVVGDRLYREACERLHEWIMRQGIVARAGEAVDADMDDEERLAHLQDVILDFGRGLHIMAVQHALTEPKYCMEPLIKRLELDALAAYDRPVKDWLNLRDNARRPLVPDLQFVPSPRRDIAFEFYE
ncbi:unnamed protein product [Peniophora sp. CBMAI 1063]|nr:unnamed protein product [Peniophora sp. CBMAI 1063]